ncbi:MAG TPA: tetratricopeptide repeat protein [Trichormus sp.]|jgi:hypothetical protein
MGNPVRNQTTQKIPVLGWRFFVGCAQAARLHGDLEAAEKHYIEALEFVEKSSGSHHGLTSAVVLLELAEFYEDHGKSDRAQSVWARVRDVLGRSLGEISPKQNLACTAGTIGSI